MNRNPQLPVIVPSTTEKSRNLNKTTPGTQEPARDSDQRSLNNKVNNTNQLAEEDFKGLIERKADFFKSILGHKISDITIKQYQVQMRNIYEEANNLKDMVDYISLNRIFERLRKTKNLSFTGCQSYISSVRNSTNFLSTMEPGVLQEHGIDCDKVEKGLTAPSLKRR